MDQPSTHADQTGSGRQNKRAVFFIFGIALVIRLIVLIISAHSLGLQHEDGYYEIADNLVRGNGYSYASEAPFFLDTYRSPGLPLLLAPFMMLPNGAWLFVVLQIIVGSTLPVLTRRILLNGGVPEKISTIVGFLFAFEPGGILLSVKILTETFFTFALLLFFLLIQKIISMVRSGETHALTRAAALAGLMLGCTAVFRPTTFYMPILILPFFLARSFRNKRALIAAATGIAVFLLCVIPWSLRNMRVYGVGSFSSIKEAALYIELAPSVLAVQNHIDEKTATLDFYHAHGLSAQPSISTADAKQFRNDAIAAIRPYPYALFKVFLVNSATFATHDGMIDLGSIVGLHVEKSVSSEIRTALTDPTMSSAFHAFSLFAKSPLLWIVVLLRIIWFALAALCIWGILYRCIKKTFDPLAVCCILLIGYFALTTLSDGLAVNARFRFPINSIIALFAIQTICMTGLRPVRSKHTA